MAVYEDTWKKMGSNKEKQCYVTLLRSISVGVNLRYSGWMKMGKMREIVENTMK